MAQAITATISTVLTPPSRHLARLLSSVPDLGPEHHWQGEYTGVSGAAVGCCIRIDAHLAFHGSLIEGAGRLADTQTAIAGWNGSLTLSGTVSGDAVSLDLWMQPPEIGRVPFAGTGTLSSDAREIAGAWSTACFNPETCGCDGGGGKYWLRRID